MAARLARLTRPLSHLQHSSAAVLRQKYPPVNTLRHDSSSSSSSSSSFQTGPSPPRLPPAEQAEFERLQRTANTQEGFNATSTPNFTSPSTSPSITITTTASSNESQVAQPEGGLSTPLRKGAPPEFDGDTNPRTGEVGGPKNEPLRWGPGGDYSYNGRVTDF